jgi:hypothetical protein
MVCGLSPESQRQRLLTAGHSCAQQYRARHHFLQESNEWDIMVLKFQTQLCAVNSVVSRLKSWKLSYAKNGCFINRYENPCSIVSCVSVVAILIYLAVTTQRTTQ